MILGKTQGFPHVASSAFLGRCGNRVRVSVYLTCVPTSVMRRCLLPSPGSLWEPPGSSKFPGTLVTIRPALRPRRDRLRAMKPGVNVPVTAPATNQTGLPTRYRLVLLSRAFRVRGPFCMHDMLRKAAFSGFLIGFESCRGQPLSGTQGKRVATFALLTTAWPEPRPARSTPGEPGRAVKRQAFATLSYLANPLASLLITLRQYETASRDQARSSGSPLSPVSSAAPS